jgi:hypothetical protein
MISTDEAIVLDTLVERLAAILQFSLLKVYPTRLLFPLQCLMFCTFSSIDFANDVFDFNAFRGYIMNLLRKRSYIQS